MANRNRGGGGGSSNADPNVVKALIESNDQMGREMEYLKNRLNALEATRQPQQSALLNNAAGDAVAANVAGGDDSSDKAVMPDDVQAPGRRGITWMDSMDAIDATTPQDTAAAAEGNDNINNPPPMRKIKFLDSSPKTNANDGSTRAMVSQQESNNNNIGLADNNNDDDSSQSSSSSSDSEAIAFSGWARCFFQARHHRSATQITSGATSTTSQDTYLYLTIHSTANELRISNTDDRWKPPLIDPPIPLKHFYAVKVPGSRSGAALFLKNDSRRLRKYIFRFEFINRSVHQPPQRYVQFVRSGNAAKKSMRGMNKVKNAFNKMGEERRENIKENKKRAQDAFAAHLGTLDELLRESDEAAERFVECVNARNEEEEELSRSQRDMMGDSSGKLRGSGNSKRSKPPPPYWGSGFNRPSANENGDDGDDDEADSDEGSDVSEEEDELYYDDDNDDETFFDKVQVSTEQTLETMFNHIVK